MGRKNAKRLIATVLLMLSLSYPIAVEASSISIYDIYKLEEVYNCPPDALKVIRDYNNANRYLRQYLYIVASDVDTELLSLRESKYINMREEVAKKLRNGYNLQLCEISNLENEWVRLSNCILDIQQAKKSNIKSEPKELVVPTEEMYLAALKIKEEYDKSTYIGDLSRVPKIVENIDSEKYSSEYTTYQSYIKETVYAPLNGVVESLDNDTLTVYAGNNVTYTLKGLDLKGMSIGDSVTQGSALGNATSTLVVVTLNLNKTQVNIGDLYENKKD